MLVLENIVSSLNDIPDEQVRSERLLNSANHDGEDAKQIKKLSSQFRYGESVFAELNKNFDTIAEMSNHAYLIMKNKNQTRKLETEKK